MKKNLKRNAFAASVIFFGLAVLVYSLIFPFYSWQHYVICGLVAFVIARIVYVMAIGVDTSKKAPVQRPIRETGDPAVDSLIKNGQEMLQKIREENDLIPDEKLTRQMNQLNETANRIFETVADQPQKAPQIRRFMEYYLPTTLKMLTGYRKLNQRSVTGENAQYTKQKIEKEMDVVLEAFSKQLDQLYSDEMLDITTDIDVLETMLRQDGLIDSGLHDNQAAK